MDWRSFLKEKQTFLPKDVRLLWINKAYAILTIIQLMIRKAQMDRSPLRSWKKKKKSQLVSVLFLNLSSSHTKALIHFIRTAVFLPPATLKICAISSVFRTHGTNSAIGRILLSKTFLGVGGIWEGTCFSLWGQGQVPCSHSLFRWASTIIPALSTM